MNIDTDKVDEAVLGLLGKGDHRHLRGHQKPYRFTTVDRLVSDFLADIAKERAR